MLVALGYYELCIANRSPEERDFALWVFKVLVEAAGEYCYQNNAPSALRNW
jgi:hypothetical protein